MLTLALSSSAYVPALKVVALTYLPLAAVAGVLALISAAGAGLFAHPAAVGQITPSQDFFWNLGNAESFLLGFPPADLRFAGVTLTYHYLTELLAAGLSMASGLAVYDVLAFYQTPLLLALIKRELPSAAELISLYYGSELAEPAANQLADAVQAAYPALAVEVYAGGQPHYPLLLMFE